MNKRIVITGIGVVSPIGAGKAAFWSSLKRGQDGISDITLFGATGLAAHRGGEIRDFDASAYLGKKGLRTMDRSTLLLSAAAALAITDAGLTIDERNTHRIGVSIGNTFGSLRSIAEFDRVGIDEGPRSVNPSLFPNTVINSPASQVSIRFAIKGFNTTLSTGMCASSDAVIYASDFIRLGRADIVIVGGVEELCEETFRMFASTGRLAGTDGSSSVNCPFDARRDGFVLAEGGAVLVLEGLDSALGRGAPIQGELLGTGRGFAPSLLSDTELRGGGISTAIAEALADARLAITEIDCIFSHANSSRSGDSLEAYALQEVFGVRLDRTAVTAIKSMIGETYSASGVMAAAAALGALRDGVLPPTLHYECPDPACPIAGISPRAVQRDLHSALVTAHDDHGNAAALILGRHARHDQ